MWMDAEGVAHTVALPDPRPAFSDDLMGALVIAATTDSAPLAALVDDLLERVEADLKDSPRDERLVGVALPDGTITDVTEPPPDDVVARLRDALVAVPAHFLLDALLATEDLLDELDDDEPSDARP